MKRQGQGRRRAFVLGILVVPLAVAAIGIVVAGPVSVPNTFTPGTPVVAAEMNANFDAVQAAINDNDARITALGHAGAIYRWAVWSTYDQNHGWYANNNEDMFGGVNPSTWGDLNGVASFMSADKEVLRTLFCRKGYGGANATVTAEQWKSYSSTNSRHAAALFRIRNTTNAEIDWTVKCYQTAYGAWGERASVALNGVSV